LQDQRIIFCHQYKGVTSLGEADNLYALIGYWWFSSSDTSKARVHELTNWLSFWHFCVKQWRGFIVHVSISPTKFL
jgi:hypothetical protein